MPDAFALVMTPAELAEEFSCYTGARWVVDQTETFHDDIICQTIGGGRVVVRRFSTRTRTNGDTWGVFTTAGTVRNEYRGSFASADEAVDHAKSLFTWNKPAEYVAPDGEVWVNMGAEAYRRNDWSEVVYFTEGESYSISRPLFGRFGWVVAQWLGRVLPHDWPHRNAVMGWFLRFTGGADCSCEFNAPCSILIHSGDACGDECDNGDRDTCAGCGRKLYGFQVAHSYKDGPVLCRKCEPDAEGKEFERKECLEAKGGECDDKGTCGAAAKCFPPDMTAKAIANLERLGGKAEIPTRTHSA